MGTISGAKPVSITSARRNKNQADNQLMKYSSRALASVIVIALSFNLAVPAAFSQADSTVIELNNEGVRALGTQNFSLAISKLEESLKRDPNYVRARENLGIAYNNYGLQKSKTNPQESLDLFEKALCLSPENPTTRANIDGIIRMLGKDPLDFKTRVELGDSARKRGHFIGSVVEYQAALRIKDDATVREKLGDVYRVQDKLDKAIAEYNSAVAMRDSAAVEVKLAQALQSKNDLSGALNATQKAMTLNPKDPDVLDALVTVWEGLLRQNPTAPENHIGLAKAMISRGDFLQAKEELQVAIRFSPANVEARQLLSELQHLQTEAEFARHLNNGKTLQLTKNLDGALDEFKLALKSHPNSADAWAKVGSIYYEQRDFENANQAYKQAINFDQSHEDARKGLQLSQAAISAAQLVSATPTAKSIEPQQPATPTTPVATIQQSPETLVTRNVNQINSSASTHQKLGRCHAILVATEKYSHQGFAKLANPVKDARDIKEILTKYYGWDVDILENRSKLDIMDSLIEAVNKKPEYDELFIYVAGHGDWDNNLHDGMIVTSDSRDKDRTRDSYITYSELKTLLERGACKKVLLALDVCFGGSFLDQIGKTRSSGSDIYQRSTLDDCITRIKDRYTRKLVTPGEKEPVYEGLPGQHSPLARNLLRTLVQQGGDRGFVRFIDLESAAMDTKPMGRAAGFSDSDDPTSDFIFVPIAK
jgi:tetratricopeptide (TPR) repeat protein